MGVVEHAMEFSESSRVVKLAVVCAIIIAGGVMDGSWKGALAWAIILVALWFAWEIAHYEPKPRQEQFQRVEDFKERIEGPAIKGRRNPDPTRPTTEDFMGMATDYIERRR